MNVKPPNPGRLVAMVVAVGIVAFAGAVLISGRMPAQEGAKESEQGLMATLKNQGRKQAIKNVNDACAPNPDSCACLQERALAALNADLAKAATEELSRDKACAEEPKSRGMRAEALTRAGRHGEALELVEQILATDPKNPFALYTAAHAAFAKGDLQNAVPPAIAAVEAGRGAQAHLLLALVLFGGEQYDAAAHELQMMLQADENDVDALYNLALIAQKQNRYRDSREGYLKVLRLNPQHADSRYNLGILTHSVGAIDEAKHNLEKLKKIVGPDDQRVSQLETVIAGPKPSPTAAMVFAKPRPSATAHPAASASASASAGAQP